jgi:hypothetical protein
MRRRYVRGGQSIRPGAPPQWFVPCRVCEEWTFSFTPQIWARCSDCGAWEFRAKERQWR